MAVEALVGVRPKLKRAWQQLDALKADITVFLDEGPYRPRFKFDKKAKRLTIYVQVHKSPDPMWSVRVGEIIHNFRSALDHIVWELAGRPPARTSKTQFPIFEYEAGFSDRGTKQFLKGLSTAAVTLIKAEQPFSTRDGGTGEGVMSPLWHLKELSDIDKHRTLHLTGTTMASYNFQFPPVAHAFQTADVYEHQAGPVQQDTVMYRATLIGTADWPFEKGDIRAGIEAEVAFEDGTPAPGVWGVHGTLAGVGNRTERILRRIAEDILNAEL